MKIEKALRRDNKILKRRNNKHSTRASMREKEQEQKTIHHKEELEYKELLQLKLSGDGDV